MEVSENPRVRSRYFACPRDGIAHSDPGWLGPCPEFETLRPVVFAHAVAVMDGLVSQQMTAKDLFHGQDVFEDVLTLASPWVVRRPDQILLFEPPERARAPTPGGPDRSGPAGPITRHAGAVPERSAPNGRRKAVVPPGRQRAWPIITILLPNTG